MSKIAGIYKTKTESKQAELLSSLSFVYCDNGIVRSHQTY